MSLNIRIDFSFIDQHVFDFNDGNNQKPVIANKFLAKTYGKRPVPFQFPDNDEKMYIGSEYVKLF